MVSNLRYESTGPDSQHVAYLPCDTHTLALSTRVMDFYPPQTELQLGYPCFCRSCLSATNSVVALLSGTRRQNWYNDGKHLYILRNHFCSAYVIVSVEAFQVSKGQSPLPPCYFKDKWHPEIQTVQEVTRKHLYCHRPQEKGQPVCGGVGGALNVMDTKRRRLPSYLHHRKDFQQRDDNHLSMHAQWR